MKQTQPYKIRTIAEYHQLVGLPRPEHPLISLVRFDDMRRVAGGERPGSLVHDFYSIALKRDFNGKLRYGQQEYDFDEGVMVFISPGQVFSVETDETIRHSGWLLIVHPDFLWNTPLAKTIRQYEFFSYEVHEALHLSEKEEATVTGILRNIEGEYRANIDQFSQGVMVTQLALLLTYAERFYHRQFITRKITNHQILSQLEAVLRVCFERDTLAKNGLPTVQYVADALNVSPNYLSSLLTVLTGQSTQQHIHDKLIEKAKEKLSTTELTVGEIAYALGFEHPQSFNRLFKTKTNLSPLAFRQSFN
ncbi:helix-turn-helix domain-containing protein [Fibrella aquatilis]|uniref:Helix-turn-helix transcriptional regulator n=1 Tax=Fibrella aquatilis TaxID=2817059 RepID=A0A939JXS9_9BACT|nr:response regulator transcription factor [Fibrella aquatilis]MBO0931344.1 helix-turn-helix transcriptional regulator [Fibrella aquatilis]